MTLGVRARLKSNYWQCLRQCVPMKIRANFRTKTGIELGWKMIDVLELELTKELMPVLTTD